MQRHIERAFSYIEVLAAITCLSLLTAAALPAWQQNQSGHHLIQTAEVIAQDLRSARNLSLDHNTPYFIHYDNSSAHTGSGSDNDWCYILATQAGCHCLDSVPAQECQPATDNNFHQVSAADHPGIHLTEARFGNRNYTRFDPVRGTASFGRLLIENDFQRRLQINISLLGRVRICQPDKIRVTGPYPAC